MERQIWDTNKWLQSGAILKTESELARVSVGPFCPSPAPEGFLQWRWGEFFAKSWQMQAGQADFLLDPVQLKSDLINLKGLVPDLEWHDANEQQFYQCFHQAQQGFATGELKKVVPVVFETASWNATPEVWAQLIATALDSRAKGHFFGHWDFQQQQGILGFTPETLFQCKNGELKTMALAGTAQNDQHDLLSDPKEMQEHQWVRQQLQAQLAQLGNVQISSPYVWTPSTLTHLRSDLVVDLTQQEFSVEQLLTLLHPTPALGGSPRAEAMELLSQWDGNPDRGEFGAPFGCTDLNTGDSHFVVSIRCLIWRKNQLLLGSGCGVVADSLEQKEWQELKNKRQSVKKIFGLL